MVGIEYLSRGGYIDKHPLCQLGYFWNAKSWIYHDLNPYQYQPVNQNPKTSPI